MGHLTVGDIAAVAGTIVGALIGVVGLAAVLGIERRDRYRTRLDEALSAVILGLAVRARERDDWTAGADTGQLRGMWMVQERARDSVGPLDVDLPAAVEVARLAGTRREDRTCLHALSDTVVKLGIASNAWQVTHSAHLATLIRQWRSGEIRPAAFQERVAAFGNSAASALGWDIDRPDPAASLLESWWAESRA
jgi:hypothetical protein